jgi:hypothetical protein
MNPSLLGALLSKQKAIRRHAAELTDACFGSTFIDCNLDGPEDSDYDHFDSIIELVIENEIYQTDDEEGPTWGDPEDVSIKNDLVDEYMQYFEEVGWIDQEDLEDNSRWRLLTSLAIDILAVVLIQEDQEREATYL